MRPATLNQHPRWLCRLGWHRWTWEPERHGNRIIIETSIPAPADAVCDTCGRQLGKGVIEGTQP